MPPVPATVGETLATAVTTATGVITTNMPLIFGIAIAFVAWNIGKRVLGKI